jgi:hypothetical protein
MFPSLSSTTSFGEKHETDYCCFSRGFEKIATFHRGMATTTSTGSGLQLRS